MCVCVRSRDRGHQLFRVFERSLSRCEISISIRWVQQSQLVCKMSKFDHLETLETSVDPSSKSLTYVSMYHLGPSRKTLLGKVRSGPVRSGHQDRRLMTGTDEI